MHDLESQSNSIIVEEKTPQLSETPQSSVEVEPIAIEKEGEEEEDSNTQDAPPGPEHQLYPETDLNQGIVGWDGQDDPANPQNFSPARKWGLLMLMSAMTFISPLASSIFAPAVSYAGTDLHVADELLLSFSVSIFLLGYTIGPLVLAPLSEIYGRRIVVSCANWFFVVWQIGCALAPNIQTLIVSRLFAGMGGVGCLTLGAGVIADLFPIQQRAKAIAIWSVGPLVGPLAGPICGGFMGETVGWRWVFWLLLILGSVLSLAIEILNRETYAPVLIHWKTQRLAKELDRSDLRSGYDTTRTKEQDTLSASQILLQGMRRPLTLLFRSPIVFLLSIYMAFIYGILYLFFTTIPSVFEDQYGFSSGLSGLAYLGIGCGFFVGLAVNGLTSDSIIVKLTAQNGGKYEPEMRLPAMLIFSCIAPISFFWYGWSADKNTHWIVPIIGMFPYGVAMMGLYLPIQSYIIDSHQMYAASAVAAVTAMRSLFAALLPLAGPKMFATLGLGWGNSLLGFVAVAFVPVPIIFQRYGKVIRTKYSVEL